MRMIASASDVLSGEAAPGLRSHNAMAANVFRNVQTAAAGAIDR